MLSSYLCTKKTKITTLFNNFFSSVLHSREYHDACACIPLLVNKTQRIRVLCQNASSCVSSITRMRCGTLENAWWRLTQKRTEEKFVFFCTLKVFSLLHNIAVVPLIWLDEFCRAPKSVSKIREKILVHNLLGNIYIYIYAFSRRFYPKRLTLHSSYSFTFFISSCFPWESNPWSWHC